MYAICRRNGEYMLPVLICRQAIKGENQSTERDEIKLPTAVYFLFCLQSVYKSERPKVKMPPNFNVPELVKTFQLKLLQLITSKIRRTLIIFVKVRVAKGVWESVFVNPCIFQRVMNSQSTPGSRFTFPVFYFLHLYTYKKLLSLKYMIKNEKKNSGYRKCKI